LLGRGEALQQLGTEAGPVAFIVYGSLRLSRFSRDGKEIIAAMRCANEAERLIPHAQTATTSHSRWIAHEPTMVFQVPRSLIMGLLPTFPQLFPRVIALAARDIGEARDQIEELATQPMRRRLARMLARRAAANRYQFVHETHGELAAFIGARQDEVTKELARLRKLGLISYKRHKHGIRVLDLARLSAL
jgi:CRP-like cAMP-binding protein